MSRCKACNKQLLDSEFRVPGIDDDGYCSECRFISDNAYFLDDREYQFETLTEIPVYVENYMNTVDN